MRSRTRLMVVVSSQKMRIFNSPSGDPMLLGPADYAGLWEQWAGANTKMTGPSLPGPEVVALAIASAIEDPATPLRVPVGQDAEMILGLRRSLDDQAFEHAMRKAVGLTW